MQKKTKQTPKTINEIPKQKKKIPKPEGEFHVKVPMQLPRVRYCAKASGVQ